MDKPKIVEFLPCQLLVPVIKTSELILAGSVCGNEEAVQKMRQACQRRDAQRPLVFTSVVMDGGPCGSKIRALIEVVLRRLEKNWEDVYCPSESQMAVMVYGMFGHERNIPRVMPIRMGDDPAGVSFNTDTFWWPHRGSSVIRYHDDHDQGVHNTMIMMMPFLAT